MVRRAIAALAALVTVAQPASTVFADPAALREARRVIEEEVRYDRAQEILVTALRQGDNGPDDLAAIYELAGVASVVLGQREAGELYFRRLLALRPQAALPADTAPKILEPFTAARAHMAAVGNLRVAARTPRARELVIEIAADPLGMVAGAQVHYAGRDGQMGQVRGDMPSPITVELPDGALATEVAIVDEYGNRLQELPAPPVPTGGDGGGGGPGPGPGGDGERGVLLRWPSWAIAAGASGAVGLGFAIDGKRSHERLDDILANPEDHFFGEAEDARRRWKRDTTVANVAFVATGVFAAGAITLAIIGRKQGGDRTAVMPWVGDRGAGIVVRLTLPAR